jgi:hypothetical protein
MKARRWQQGDVVVAQAAVFGAEHERGHEVAGGNLGRGDFRGHSPNIRATFAIRASARGRADDEGAPLEGAPQARVLAARREHVSSVHGGMARLLEIETGVDDVELAGAHVLDGAAHGADVGAANRANEDDADGAVWWFSRCRQRRGYGA